MPRPSAVRPEEMRRHNLSLLLGEIHQHGEQTRAELTLALGLNRSTIGGLVADLVDLGLVAENIPSSRDRAGRPSHVVSPRDDGPYVLAVDVAVGRVVCAAVGLGGTIHARRETPMDGQVSPDAVVEQILDDSRWLARRLAVGCRRVGAGVSVPATVRQSDGFVDQAPNLEWRDVPFGALVSAALGGEGVQVGNDADLGAIAEHRRGAARNYEHVIFVNGSVGVGAGIISSGVPIRGSGGYAGEIGHMMLDPSGLLCHCGSTGCVETYIGENALLRAAGVPEPHSPAAVVTVFRNARSGDATALAAVQVVAMWLGRTLGNVVNIFNPQAVVVGGTLAEVMRLGAATVESELDRRAMSAARRGVTVLLPSLGTDSALIGAAEVAFQPLLAAPDTHQLSPTTTAGLPPLKGDQLP